MSSKFTWIVVGIVVFFAGAFASIEFLPRSQTVQLEVTGMSCEGCAGSVTEALKRVPGVRQVNVTLRDAPEATAENPAKLGLVSVEVDGLKSYDQTTWDEAIALAGPQFKARVSEPKK